MIKLPKKFFVVLTLLLLTMMVVPVEVMGYHTGKTTQKNQAKQVNKPKTAYRVKNSPIVGFLLGFNKTTSKVLGAATEGTQNLWQRFTGWLSNLVQPKYAQKSKTLPLVTAPTKTPAPTVAPVAPVEGVKVTKTVEGLSAGDGISITDDLISVVASALAGKGLKVDKNNFNVDVGTGKDQIVQLDANGNLPVVGGKYVTNLDAGNLEYGKVKEGLLNGHYTNITGVGHLAVGTWEGDIVADTYVSNNLTLGTVSGNPTFSGNVTFQGTTSQSSTGKISFATTAGQADALELIATNGGIDISTGGDTQDIDILAGDALNITSVRNNAAAVVITATAGGIDILATGAAAGEDIDITATGSSVNLSSTEGVENAVTVVASAGGINISTGSGAAGNDIDILSGSSINLTAAESAVDSIVLTSSAGGIDILATGAAAGEDIDIAATGSSVNVSSTESAADAITLTTNSAAGGIDLSTGGQLGQGGAIDILSGNAAAVAITIVAPQGGIDISTGSGTQDIDVLGGASVNIRSSEGAADSITIVTNAATGGIDISTGGQLGQGGSIDILGGQAAAAALTLVTPQGGIDISTGGSTQNIDILSGAGANLVAVSSGIDISTGGQGSSGGSIDILSGQGAATAITIVAGQGGIDISTGSGTQDIDVLGGASVNLRSTEAAADSITIVTNGSTGGIDISTGGQLGQGGSIDILSGQAAATALSIVAPQGGIDISTGSGAAGNDIDILSGSSINLTAAESAVDSIVLTSSAGGIDILATGAAAGEDIDITATGSSVNVSSTESIANAITLTTNSAAGGIDLSTGGQAGQGGAIDILSGNAAAVAITIVAPQGGIDISTGTGTAGNDIDLLAGASINLSSLESVADAITLTTNSAAGGIDLSTGGQIGKGGSIDILGGQSAATAITIVAPQGGIDISTGSATQDIDILGGASVNLRSTEAAADSITIVTNGSSGGIDISTGGQLGQGGSIDILSGQAAAAALTLVTPQGGIDISTGSGAAGNDIDILSGSSINLTAAESAVDSIVLTSTAGGIDILATGAAAGEDIDIAATGSSVNVSSTESIANAITLTTNSAAGGIDLSTGGQAGQGGAIDILSGNAAAAALTLVTPQGGIDISTGSGAAGNDIDLLGGSSINLSALESVADAITLTTNSAAGGIDISTGGQIGRGGSIDILSGQGAATAITIVAPQGGIDISTGSGTQNIDILGGNGINLRSVGTDLSLSSGSITTSSGLAVDSATGFVGVWTSAPAQELEVDGDIQLDANLTQTANAVCHSGADSDTTFVDRVLVACSDAPGDIAEWYETKAGVKAGDVVTLSGETIEYSYDPMDPFTGTFILGAKRTERVAVLKKSEKSYEVRVMGVVSTSPYQAFGDAIREVAKNPQPVALSGRAPVNVTNEGGAIEVGDYLTTSSTPGYAMKASREGMVLGTALEPFEGEKGQVMVFVGRGYVDDSVYEQLEVLEALGMADVLGATIAEVGGLDQADELGDVVATTDGEVLAVGDDPLPVLKTQAVDELTVTTAAKFQGTLVVVGEAIFEGLLTVNGAEVKGDLGVVGAVTQTFVAGEDIAAGDAVYLAAENTVRKASAASEGTLPAIGVAAGSAGSGASVKVAIAGTVNGLAGLNTGRRYYVGLGMGSITVSKPEGAAGAQVIGVARSASQLVVMPGLDYSTNTEAPVVPVPTPEPALLPTPEPSVAPEASSSSTTE